MTQHQTNVREFMKSVGQTVRDKPEMPTFEEKKRMAHLILEEVFETICDGLGLQICIQNGGSSSTCAYVSPDEVGMDHVIHLYEINSGDLVKLADGCADSSVVINGCASGAGIDLEPIELEVDRSNLSKAIGGHKDEITSKWIKPASYSPANIQPIIEAQKV